MKVRLMGMLAAALVAGVPAIAETSPDIFQITKSIRLEAGFSGQTIQLATAPVNKRMVIQTIALYRETASAGTVGTPQGALYTSLFGTTSVFPMLAVEAFLREFQCP